VLSLFAASTWSLVTVEYYLYWR